jgi:hypothetical protein
MSFFKVDVQDRYQILIILVLFYKQIIFKS